MEAGAEEETEAGAEEETEEGGEAETPESSGEAEGGPAVGKAVPVSRPP